MGTRLYEMPRGPQQYRTELREALDQFIDESPETFGV
jgi:hypothetical protein